MTLSIAVIIISLFVGYSYTLVSQSVQVQRRHIVPFLFRVHTPNAMKVLTQQEHTIIHDKIDMFNLRIVTCFIAALLAVGLGLFFVALVLYEGNSQLTGYLMTVLFAYVGANYNVNTSAISWIRTVENDILARVIVNNQEASEYDTLDEYLASENRKMIADFQDEMNQIAEDFDVIAEECGFDPDKDYEETDETYAEFLAIMQAAQEKMRDKYPDVADNFTVDFAKEHEESREE